MLVKTQVRVNLQEKKEAKNKRELTLINNRTSIVVAIIAAITTLISVAFTYYFVERVRNQISAQTLALENIKLDVSRAAQSTAETVVAIDAARLELQRQAASIEEAKLGIQLQTVSIDNSRLGLQRQIAQASNRNDTKKAEIDDQRRKADEIRLASELAKAENELIPIIVVSCNTQKYTQRLVKLHCNFVNKGTNKVMVTPVKFALLNSVTQKPEEDGIENLENSNDSNSLLPGTSGDNTYDIYLSQKGDGLRNRQISVKIKAVTDATATGKLREVTKEHVSEERLASLPIYYYTFIANVVD